MLTFLKALPLAIVLLTVSSSDDPQIIIKPTPANFNMSARSTGRFVTSQDGTRIFAEARGDASKPPVVFIHGFGLGATAFDEIFNDPIWVSQVYMIRYDTRGHGRSDKPTDAASWASERLAQDFDAVAQSYQLSRTHIADILSFHPADYLSGIIYDAAIPDMADLLTVSSPRRLATQFVLNRTQSATGLLNAGRSGQLSLLAIFGEEDKLVQKQPALDVIKGWKKLTVATLPKAEHFTWISQPVLFRTTVLQWISEQLKQGI
ncbi:putative oxidoreductase ephD [Favolaschia claudopus]|uniref:Oxidoreductase ephD n=1 Tax=Favolaschia claudopus TaxID=2862362 RepID=A0AAW0D198_9AGAR